MSYVEDVLRLYRRLPGTACRVRPADRALAADLHRRQIPFERVKAALLLGCARRLASTSTLLSPIRSLHYFLPVLEELRQSPALEAGYLAYLEGQILRKTASSRPS
jgi:hypothetical protein